MVMGGVCGGGGCGSGGGIGVVVGCGDEDAGDCGGCDWVLVVIVT